MLAKQNERVGVKIFVDLSASGSDHFFVMLRVGLTSWVGLD